MPFLPIEGEGVSLQPDAARLSPIPCPRFEWEGVTLRSAVTGTFAQNSAASSSITFLAPERAARMW